MEEIENILYDLFAEKDFHDSYYKEYQESGRKCSRLEKKLFNKTQELMTKEYNRG